MLLMDDENPGLVVERVILRYPVTIGRYRRRGGVTLDLMSAAVG